MLRLASLSAPASSGVADWRRSWLDEFACDMPSVVPYPREALTVLLRRAAAKHPSHPACTIYQQSMTFAELDEMSRRFASGLMRLGVRPGQHVGLMLPNIPEYLAALQGVWLTGATALQLSPLMVAEEIEHWVESTGCKVVVTLDMLEPAVRGSLRSGLLDHIVVTSLIRRMAMWQSFLYGVVRLSRNGYLTVPDDAHRHRFESLLAEDPVDRGVEVDPATAVAVLAPTGGTTSSPKAVMLTHRNLIANAMQLRHWLGGDDTTDDILAVLPFFHAYGLSVSLLTAWAGANTMHLHPRFEARATADIITRRKPRVVPAVPAMLAALNKVIDGNPPDWSHVRAVVSGASALSPEVRAAFEKTKVGALVEGYGLTEAGPVTHTNPSVGGKPGKIGKPLPDTTAWVVDPDTGAEVAPGEVGELLVRGPQVMKGYFNNPLATEQTLAGGKLHTGDMVRVDEDGFTAVVDRKRDIIKASGFLVFPAEVEEVLLTHPDVAEAAVIGIPDAERGEVVKAILKAREGKTLDIANVEAFCRLHLGKHKRPRRFEVVDELPKNFLGKILRRKLREA